MNTQITPKSITVDWLNKIGMNQKHIEFLQRNQLVGIPVELIEHINGDYEGLINYIKLNIPVKCESINSNMEYIVEYPDGYMVKYDKKGNVIWRMDLEGNEFEYRYNFDGYLVWEKDCLGNEYEYLYDQKGNLIYEKNKGGVVRKIQYRYDIDGNMIWKIDQFGNKYKYDCCGNVIFIKYVNGTEIELQYDCNNNVIFNRINEKENWFKYDQYGNMIYRKDSDWKIYTWKFSYDCRGNVVKKNDCFGNESTYEVEYYSGGQLKRYGDLYIPHFQFL